MSALDPLRLAAMRDDVDELRELLDQGGDPNSVGRGGQPLLVAALCGLVAPGSDVIALLLERGADPNLTDPEGNAALHAIASHPPRMRRGRKEAEDRIPPTAQLLIEHAADVTARNGAEMTPLEAAAAANHRVMANWLLSHGAECTLHVACRLDLVDEVRQFLAGGADVNAPGFDGRQPLHEAAAGSAFGAAELLLAAGAAVDAVDSGGQTPLHHAAKAAAADGSMEVVELLLRHGADPSAVDGDRRTPVDAAMSYVEEVGELPRLLPEDLVDLLLLYGATGFGIHAAAVVGDLARVRELLDEGVSPNLKGPAGRTPIFFAAEQRRREVTELLLARSALVNVRDGIDGLTPLHLAAWNDDSVTIAMLLEHRALVNRGDGFMQTPLDYAREGSAAADLLRERGGKTLGELARAVRGEDAEVDDAEDEDYSLPPADDE